MSTQFYNFHNLIGDRTMPYFKWSNRFKNDSWKYRFNILPNKIVNVILFKFVSIWVAADQCNEHAWPK